MTASHPSRRTRATAALAAVALASALSSCASAPVEPPPTTFPRPTCQRPPGPVYPDTQATLTATEANKVWCLRVGGTVVVQLTAASTKLRHAWPTAESSNPQVLRSHGNGPVTTPKGVTATFFEARKPGEVQVSAARGDDQTWAANVLITE